ncbi:MAG: hypothetical protein ACTSX7_09575 [Alphaproteobacteria bacterium]
MTDTALAEPVFPIGYVINIKGQRYMSVRVHFASGKTHARPFFAGALDNRFFDSLTACACPC